ncbi:hypothetical protein CANARDRAFT_10064 [[Candida] arabinofermentans NRRL YB-2248]|uniref:4-amino-5-hydroxymethyl-2-methylpyrimidine phosphate synthase n=1 Tax=[Candida] arabinofermentans NRRL YB-2248 TaxID=983967 RepID=A0A1E4STZ0_9ASCO|nr:hypothetical protein CANARDRAFT_10064 [[Candida] arabinofermentans NRRL YB-2248]
MSSDKITFSLNWSTEPYHIPVYLAQSKGYFKEQGIDVAIMEPSNPSDVTELIGSGKIDLGLKAMIHTLAAKARGWNVTSIGSLLDEPFTGVLYLKGKSGIVDGDFTSLKGKKIGYVGEFGKIQIDELCGHYGMTPDDYTAVRCGMNVAKEIIEGNIDAGIGIECVQQVELEEHLRSQGEDINQVGMLRIDRLAELGCCCFCTVLYIGNDEFIANNPDKVRKFMNAIKKATDFVINSPLDAFEEFCSIKPLMNNDLNTKVFERCFAYLSDSCYNVDRDWQKVNNYGKRLLVLPSDFKPNYTNEFLEWEKPADVSDPDEAQRMMGLNQEYCKCNGGYRRLVLNSV